ncbi:hypothetical protein CXB40_07505 [Pseudomonas syringae pv. avii]|nr:hypothetical protein CXB40_07505 [Pseudomonas syringae pv. avii]
MFWSELPKSKKNLIKLKKQQQTKHPSGSQRKYPAISTTCSGLMKPDTHLGENARHREVSDDQATPYLFP